MSLKNTIQAIEQQSVDAAALTLIDYTPVNPAGLGKACFRLRITNFNTMPITISYDLGVTVHDSLEAHSSLDVLGGTQASSPQNATALWPANTVVSVSGAAGVGTVSVA